MGESSELDMTSYSQIHHTLLNTSLLNSAKMTNCSVLDGSLVLDSTYYIMICSELGEN